MNTVQILIICVTVFLIAITIAVAFCMYHKIHVVGGRRYQELLFNMNECRGNYTTLFKYYAEIQRDLSKIEKKLK